MAKKTAKPEHVEPEDNSMKEPEGEEGHERTAPASKSEAIRQALAAGFEGPQEGTAYILKEFGIEISPSHFSAVKATEKKKGEAAPKGKPGRKKTAPSQPVEGYLAPPPKPAPTAGSDLLDAMEAIKPLVASLGKEQVKRIVDLLG